MSSDTLEAKPLITIPEAFVYEVKHDEPILLAQGSLLVLKVDSMKDVYIIQVGNYSYSILKDMPVLASSNEEGALRSYVLSNVDDFIVIRILAVPDEKMLSELEEFFSKNTKFAEKEKQPEPENAEEKIEEGAAQKEQEPFSMSSLIYRGGEAVKDLIIAGAELLASGLNSAGEYIQHNYLKKDHIEIGDMTMKALEWASTATGWVVKIKRSKIERLVNYGRSVLMNVAKRRTQQDPNGVDGITRIGSATIYGLLNVYEGMMDALSIIQEKGIHETTSKLVGHRYGVRAETAARHFLRSVSNATQSGIIRSGTKVEEPSDKQ